MVRRWKGNMRLLSFIFTFYRQEFILYSGGTDLPKHIFMRRRQHRVNIYLQLFAEVITLHQRHTCQMVLGWNIYIYISIIVGSFSTTRTDASQGDFDFSSGMTKHGAFASCEPSRFGRRNLLIRAPHLSRFSFL